MLAAADQAGNHFTLFGGEPLLAGKEVCERLFKHGLEKWGNNNVQTNGTLIDAGWIAIFKKFNVSIGVSIDGPDELNDLRTAGSLEETRAATDRTIENLIAMRRADLRVSVIITLHRLNGREHGLTRLKDFILWLGSIGIIYGNIHTLENENLENQLRYALTQPETTGAFLDLAAWFEMHPARQLHYVPFVDYKAKLIGEDQQSQCVWNFCDPLTTDAVHGIETDGTLSNCGRTAKEGVNWRKAELHGYERYISLYQSDQDKGGCRGCRFFIFCGGQCPGEGIDQDWRNKTEHCPTIMALYTYYEQRLLLEGTMPLSLSPERHLMEQRLLDSLKSGRRMSVAALEAPMSTPTPVPGHGDIPHGDKPHGDSHSDSG